MNIHDVILPPVFRVAKTISESLHKPRLQFHLKLNAVVTYLGEHVFRGIGAVNRSRQSRNSQVKY